MKKIELNERLLKISSLLPPDKIIGDVGTDHGYLPIYLALQKKCKKIIASDKNKGPLETAKRHMIQHGVSEKIELRLGGGLSPYQKNELDILIIAGMGGSLIRDILLAEIEKVKCMEKIILQPQKDIPLLRYFAHEQGFKIQEEIFLWEEGIPYFILSLELGHEKYESKADYWYGKSLIQKKSKSYFQYLTIQGEKTKKLLQELELLEESEEIKNRKKQLLIEIELLKEVLNHDKSERN